VMRSGQCGSEREVNIYRFGLGRIASISEHSRAISTTAIVKTTTWHYILYGMRREGICDACRNQTIRRFLVRSIVANISLFLMIVGIMRFPLPFANSASRDVSLPVSAAIAGFIGLRLSLYATVYPTDIPRSERTAENLLAISLLAMIALMFGGFLAVFIGVDELKLTEPHRLYLAAPFCWVLIRGAFPHLMAKSYFRG